MTRKLWMAAVALVLGVGCGGGGGGGGSGPQEYAATSLSDVHGYNVAAGTEDVDFQHWPSWLHEGELVSACAQGQVSYADRCWDSMAIDVDAGTVSFSGGGTTSVLAMGAGLPTALGNALVDSAHGCFAVMDNWSCVFPHHAATGFVYMTGPVMAGMGYAADDLWDAAIVGYDLGRPSKRAPWAIGTEIELESGYVGGFAVKTTQLYGLKQTKETPTAGDYEIVHNWGYSGSLKVNGATLTLPVNIGDVAVVAHANVLVGADGSSYVDLGGRTVRITSEHYVLDARTQFGGGGAGLNDAGLVTSVEFSSTALLAP